MAQRPIEPTSKSLSVKQPRFGYIGPQGPFKTEPIASSLGNISKIATSRGRPRASNVLKPNTALKARKSGLQNAARLKRLSMRKEQ